MREGPRFPFVSWMQQSTSLTNAPKNSGTTITLVKAEPGLINKYHMRTVLMVPISVPACPNAASVVMIMSILGHLAGHHEQYPAATKRLWTVHDLGDADLWHSCVPRYHPLRQPKTRQLNNEFKNSRWDIGWHDCHFVLRLKFMHSDSTQLNVFDTNTTHCLLELLEKSALLWNELVGAGQNRRWTVKCCRGWGRSFENCRGYSDEINIDFHRLWGKRTRWWVDSTLLTNSIYVYVCIKRFIHVICLLTCVCACVCQTFYTWYMLTCCQ